MNTAIGRKSGGMMNQVSNPQDIVNGIDHLIVMVRDLERSERVWQALGFATTPRGYHQSGGTANHLIMLDRTYIELLGMADPAADSPYRSMMAEAPGLWGIALRGSAEEAFRFWGTRGLKAAPPVSLARPVEIGGRKELARFQLTMLERSPELPFLLFCCEHRTPELVWRPDVAPHPNGTRSLKELVLIVEGPATQREFERLTGGSVTMSADGSAMLVLGDARLAFLSQAAFLRRFGPQAEFRGCARPMLAACVLTAADLNRARRCAKSAGWPIRDAASGGFVVYVPEEGVVIEWAPEA